MIRTFFAMTVMALMASGCCGPTACGPAGCGQAVCGTSCCGATDCGQGCGVQCNDCDGLGSNTVPTGPLDSLRQVRRNMVCGSGCGEAYYGEWRSTPPDCTDPCVGSQFVGGATAARPFCWQPGQILGNLAGNLYGGRYCNSCGVLVNQCECGGEVIEGGYTEAQMGCGCAACNQLRSNGARMASTKQMQNRVIQAPARNRQQTATVQSQAVPR